MHSDRVTTTGSEGRKSSKPIMEKRRRARINASLAELKSLLLEVIKKEGARHSKMEKADILEMAVKHLRQVQRQQYTSGGTDPTLSDKYRLGFNECAQEVSRYLGATDDDDAELRARLLNHLANCITSSDPPSPLSTPSSSPAPLGHVTSSSGGSGGSSGGGGGSVVTPVTPIPVRPLSKTGERSISGLSLITQGDPGGSSPGSAATAAVLVPNTEINNNNVGLANNNIVSPVELRTPGGTHQMTLSPVTSSPPVGGRKLMGEVQVVGAKPGGEGVALVLPANVMTGGPLPSYIIPLYASPHPLSGASLSFTPSAPPQQTGSTLPSIPLPVVATTPTSTNPQVPSSSSPPGNAPSVVTLTPGAALSPAALSPAASVGHVIATGLNGPLTWQTAATAVYPAPVSSVPSSAPTFLPTSSTNFPSLAAASSSSSSSSPPSTSLVLSSTEIRPTDDRVTSSVSSQPMAALSTVAPTVSVPDSSGAGAEPGARLSLLHCQLLRPQGSAGPLQGADNCVWRPW